MPELPEVETTRRGLAPHVEGRRVTAVTLRRPDLRWPIPAEVARELPGQRITAVRRRAKYLLLDTGAGDSALLHLGMSGMLRVLPADTPVGAHDHVDLGLDSGRVLRLTDPRRFGSLLWQPAGTEHALLRGLGPEPLSDAFDGAWLFARSRGRSAPVKTFLMDQKIVVGVGNIGYRKFNRPFWRVWRVGSGRASAALGTDRAQIGGSCVGFRHRGATQRLSA